MHACRSTLEDPTFPIEEKRTLAKARPEQMVQADTKRRLTPPEAPHDHGGSPHGDMAPAAGRSLAWDLPEGWKEVAPTPLRTGNFVVPGRDRLEAYVTLLPGGGGGTAANINRWRKQMSAEPLSEADVAALPRVKLFGADAPYVEIDGTFKGAGAQNASEGFTMAACIAERGGAAITAKLVGPSAEVRAEVERFKALCASLRPADSVAPAQPEDPSPPAKQQDGLRWTAPDGWKEGPAKTMRLVTFLPADSPGVECYVTVLSGAGGGLEPNVNRWRGQLGQPALSAGEIAALPVIEVLGQKARMVEIDGGANGLYGLVCELGAQSVFVKMTGPMEGLRREKERFLAFCRSLS